LESQVNADGIRWLRSLPAHVKVSEIAIRPTGQVYP
jgi:NADP-dependent 3-hydroxy acid dehydrogenase YdfG